MTLGGNLKVTQAANFAPTLDEMFTIILNEGMRATGGPRQAGGLLDGA